MINFSLPYLYIMRLRNDLLTCTLRVGEIVFSLHRESIHLHGASSLFRARTNSSFTLPLYSKNTKCLTRFWLDLLHVSLVERTVCISKILSVAHKSSTDTGLKIIFKVHRMIYPMGSDMGRILSDRRERAVSNILRRPQTATTPCPILFFVLARHIFGIYLLYDWY